MTIHTHTHILRGRAYFVFHVPFFLGAGRCTMMDRNGLWIFLFCDRWAIPIL